MTLNDLPAEDFAVVLAGPNGSQLVATAKDGSYAFTGLPAGDYSMMVERAGIGFVPAVVDFTLSTESKRQDFVAFTAENGIIVQPSVIRAGSPDVTLTIYGRNFNPTSTAYIGPLALKTTFLVPTQLKAVLPASQIQAPAEFSIVVVTDGSRRSDPFPMLVFVDQPQLDKVESSPQELHEGIPGATLILTGSGFIEGATVKIDGKSDGITVTIVNSTQILATVPWNYFVLGGIYSVTVTNPYPANSDSNILPLRVFYPRPAVEVITPKTISERIEDSSGPLTLEVFGYGFRRGAVVLVEDVAVPTAYCEGSPACLSEHLTATVPPQMLHQAGGTTLGFKKISVRNPDPSLEAIQVAFLRVESLQPTVTSLEVGTATLLADGRYDLVVVMNGTNFDEGTQVRVRPVHTVCTPETEAEFAGADKILSTTQLFFTFPVEYPCSIGEWMVDARNVQPGGGTSTIVNFIITEAAFVSNPFLASLAPGIVAAGGPAFTLTINGMNFQPDSQVNFYSVPLLTTFVNQFQLKAVVPDYLIFTAGKKPISVTNRDNGGTSNRLFIEIR